MPGGGITFKRVTSVDPASPPGYEKTVHREEQFNRRQNIADSIKGSRVLMKNHQIH